MICNNTFFRTKYEVQRHLQSQHTGIGYQCSLCGMIFTSRNYKHSCDVRESDMIFIHRITGEKGEAAKEIMAKFIREEQDSKWRYVKTMDELELPITDNKVTEPSRQPRPRKLNSKRIASPAPSVQLEEPEEINLDEPPPKVPRLEISRLELEPVSSASSQISDLDITPSVSDDESSSSSSSESSSESESESESEIEMSPKRLVKITSKPGSDRVNKKSIQYSKRNNKESNKESENKKVENENRKEKDSNNEKQCDDDNSVVDKEVNKDNEMRKDKVVESSKNIQNETQRETSKDRNNNEKSVQKENEKGKEIEKEKQKDKESGSKINKKGVEKESCKEKRNDKGKEINKIRNSDKEKSAQNEINSKKDSRKERQLDNRKLQKVTETKEGKIKNNCEKNQSINNDKQNEKNKKNKLSKDKDKEKENSKNRKEMSVVKDKDKQSQKENENNKRLMENDIMGGNNKESECEKLNPHENAKDKQNSGEIVSGLLLDRIMSDITNTFSNTQHMDEETLAAVESITQRPLDMAIEKAMDEFCDRSVRLMQETVINETVTGAISEAINETRVIEEEVDEMYQKELEQEIVNIAKESVLDVSLEAAEERRLNLERQREEEKRQKEVCEMEGRTENRKRKHDEIETEECSDDDDEEICNLRKIQSKRVVLNIGGVRFETSRMALQKDPTSLLAKIESNIIPQGNSIFIDRDQSHFRLILYYLRNDCQLPSLAVLPRERRYLLELEN